MMDKSFLVLPILTIKNPFKAIATFLILLMNLLDFVIYMNERGFLEVRINKNNKKKRMKQKHNKKSIDLSHSSKKVLSTGKAWQKESTESTIGPSTAKGGKFLILENPSTLWV